MNMHGGLEVGREILKDNFSILFIISNLDLKLGWAAKILGTQLKEL